MIFLYEKSAERQERIIKTVAAAFGGSAGGSSGGKNEKQSYTGGEIAHVSHGQKSSLFGYQKVNKSG